MSMRIWIVTAISAGLAVAARFASRIAGAQQPVVTGEGFAAIPNGDERDWPGDGRIQKFRPRPGTNPAFCVGKPWPGV